MNKNNIAKPGLTVACPTCSARPGKRCELNTGGMRNVSHLDRRWAELDAIPMGKQKIRAVSAGG
jgi:hypothetical protein